MAKRESTRPMPEERPTATADMSPTEPELTQVQQDAQARLEAIERRILQLSVDAETAEDKEIPRLMRELQRARVAKLCLKEIVTDLADPTTYREMTLLNKLITGVDPEEEAAKRMQLEEELAAEDRLSKVGVDPERADGLVRALNALSSLMNRNDDGPPEQPPASRRLQ